MNPAKKIVAIVGSYRKEGTVDKAVSEILDGVEERLSSLEDEGAAHHLPGGLREVYKLFTDASKSLRRGEVDEAQSLAEDAGREVDHLREAMPFDRIGTGFMIVVSEGTDHLSADIVDPQANPLGARDLILDLGAGIEGIGVVLVEGECFRRLSMRSL